MLSNAPPPEHFTAKAALKLLNNEGWQLEVRDGQLFRANNLLIDKLMKNHPDVNCFLTGLAFASFTKSRLPQLSDNPPPDVREKTESELVDELQQLALSRWEHKSTLWKSHSDNKREIYLSAMKENNEAVQVIISQLIDATKHQETEIVLGFRASKPISLPENALAFSIPRVERGSSNVLWLFGGTIEEGLFVDRVTEEMNNSQSHANWRAFRNAC